MDRISLSFSEAIKATDLISGNSRTYPGSEKNGIYIWGFIIRSLFIPYYVGKSEKPIASRIKQHIDSINSDNSTYMRLSPDYIEGNNPFYSDPCFKLITSNWSKSKLPGWIREDWNEFKSKILYLNNYEFFQKNEVPVPLGSGRCEYTKAMYCKYKQFHDYLKDNSDKIHVMYAAADYRDGSGVESNSLTKSRFYEIIEAFTKYHLKGKTCSKSLSFGKLRPYLPHLEISRKTWTHSHHIFKEFPSEEFLGY